MNKLCILAAFGPGMGLAIARRFAREGFDLAVISRSALSDPAILDALTANGGVVRSYAANLADPGAIAAVMVEIEAQQGAADVLVYNGGVWNEGPPLAQAAASQKNVGCGMKKHSSSGLMLAQLSAIVSEIVRRGEYVED